MDIKRLFLLLVFFISLSFLALAQCPTYRATNVTSANNSLHAILSLDGPACSTRDVTSLNLIVTYEETTRLHVRILDASSNRYEVPEQVVPRPSSAFVQPSQAALAFSYDAFPFSFTVTRRANNETLFSTSDGPPLVYRDRHISLRTVLPLTAAIFGLGESTDPFRIPPGTLRTLWARDAYGTDEHTNLYGSHPVYFDHRPSGTHGVFLLNSNGMDVSVESDFLQYDIIGGVLDLYFLSGPSPIEVAQQYSQIIGRPAMVPYWSLGFQQCRFGYKSLLIFLILGWTDIDYMNHSRVFTLDPENFPLQRMREIVDQLHAHNQRYVMVMDPAVAYQPGDNGAFDRGTKSDIFLKEANGTYYKEMVWAGASVYPDWFHTSIQSYWSGEFQRFFDPESGIDIDGILIDMNEPALPVANVRVVAKTTLRTLSLKRKQRRQAENRSVDEYDTHNLFGTLMSSITRKAMLERRPNLMPVIISRSTFPGLGARAGHWTGDNISDWTHYRASIIQMLSFASIFQIPFVGSDVCGFGGNATEELCGRNHNEVGSLSQEFYRWSSVTRAARVAIILRYSLLDYLYTQLRWQQHDGTPAIQPLWFVYPDDPQLINIQSQFFFGDALVSDIFSFVSFARNGHELKFNVAENDQTRQLVSPVMEENSTSVKAYIPEAGISGLRITGREAHIKAEVKMVTFLATLGVQDARVTGGGQGELRVDSEAKIVQVIGNWSLSMGDQLLFELELET
ncbi:uncharacterized protein MELLADRAFT_102419 [Melampsora larici-populina 98AG31]|uniref:beta-glucosidase n=1 Tax=Melampsora larici-populina (strain 98AG31 / pathotype 3-4-7) TaxID=747676 RepID=F4R886_MELLP|nr:uncharacterized protein MELLADRAFT_102419 [Melampsora larici-populina 98AG31]EGG11657.1 hypothetical protein MELLADRAFT_102419 [Melampsora larici-populina 98AG31]